MAIFSSSVICATRRADRRSGASRAFAQGCTVPPADAVLPGEVACCDATATPDTPAKQAVLTTAALTRLIVLTFMTAPRKRPLCGIRARAVATHSGAGHAAATGSGVARRGRPGHYRQMTSSYKGVTRIGAIHPMG